VVALGLVNRRRLLAMLPERGTLWSVVRVEVAIALLVLAVTAALVNRPPAGADAASDAPSASAGPFNAQLVLDDQPAEGSIDVTVDPARVGTNDIHLYFLDEEGIPRPVDAIEVRVSRLGVPPRSVDVTPFTADHASSLGVTFPTPGSWTVEITSVYRSETSTASTEVPVR
jgi:copper transport protein